MLSSIFLKSSEFAAMEPVRHDDVVLVLPYIDHEQAVRAEEVLRVRAKQPGVLVLVDDDERQGFIRVANQVYSRSESPLFGYLAQDAFPGEEWLKEGVNAMKGSGAGLLAFNDGRFFGSVATFGLVNRAWVSGLYHNMVFYPGYKTHYADTELSAIAYSTNQLIVSPNALLVEVDYEKHRKANDPRDEALYQSRVATAFEGLIG